MPVSRAKRERQRENRRRGVEKYNIWRSLIDVSDPTPAEAILLEKARMRQGFNEDEFFGENELPWRAGQGA